MVTIAHTVINKYNLIGFASLRKQSFYAMRRKMTIPIRSYDNDKHSLSPFLEKQVSAVSRLALSISTPEWSFANSANLSAQQLTRFALPRWLG
jgi:hypothetical protein